MQDTVDSNERWQYDTRHGNNKIHAYIDAVISLLVDLKVLAPVGIQTSLSTLIWGKGCMADETEHQVELGFQHYVAFSATGKKWLVPDSLIKTDDDHTWLQIATANYGLCNLLSKGSVGKQPTLKGSKGLGALLEMRANNVPSQLQGNDLFEEDAEPSKPVKRRKKASNSDEPHSITLNLPDFGPLVVKTSKKRTEDLHIAYTAENVGVFCKWMLAMGIEGDSEKRRAYTQSGKYAKSSNQEPQE